MCGLFAAIGPGIVKADLEFLQSLAYVSGLRGLDGTGVVQGRTYYNHTSHKVFKQDVEVGYFMYHQNVLHKRKVMEDVMDNFILGHVRASTVGNSTLDNTHPFEFDNLIGMHNGTLTNKEFLEPAHKLGKTDSEMMFSKMDEEGVEPVLKRINSVGNEASAYAVMVYDRKTGNIKIARNSKRPLHYAFNTKRGVMYIASEAGMLRWLLARSGIETTAIKAFDVDTVFEINPVKVAANGGLAMSATPMFPVTELTNHGTVLEERLAAIEKSRVKAVESSSEQPESSVKQADKTVEEEGKTSCGLRSVPTVVINGVAADGLRINGKAIRKMKLPPLQSCSMCGSKMDDYAMSRSVTIDDSLFCEDCEVKLERMNGTL